MPYRPWCYAPIFRPSSALDCARERWSGELGYWVGPPPAAVF